MTASNEIRNGSQIGAYVLDWRLGGGSFGEVWRGHEAATGEAVAVKLLTGMLSSPNNAAMRAEVETLAAAAAGRSEHVVKVLGGGVAPMPYIVMEYVEGSDLSAQLKDGGRLGVEKTIDIGVGVAKALAALNEAGIVHRDIKPANVMVDNRGLVKLADFGIAKIVGYETVTMTGQVAMTMAYAAPEVWDDDSPFGRPSHRSDLYALGILLYQCLTGETPFRGNYGALYRQHTERPPDLTALPDQVPASLRQLIRRCLEKRPASRPENAQACLAMLDRAQAELTELRDGALAGEPERFGPWLKLSPHPTQPWAWRCRHEELQEEATVEVLFSDDLEYGSQVRRAVSVSPRLQALGAERLIDTNRLLLQPDEAWQAPPKGAYQFWLAREDLSRPAAASVGISELRAATVALSALMSLANDEELPLSFHQEDFAVVQDGGIYARRVGLLQSAGDTAADALAMLRLLPLEQAARDLIASSTSFEALELQLVPSSGAEQDATMVAERPGDATVQFTRTCPSCRAPYQAGDKHCANCNFLLQPGAASAAAALSMDLRQANSSGAASEYEVTLQNLSAGPMLVDLTALDDSGALDFELPRQVSVPQGGRQRILLRVSARRRRYLGGNRTRPFSLVASSSDGLGPLVTREGEFDEKPSGVALYAGGGAVALVLVAAALFFGLKGGSGGGSGAVQQPPVAAEPDLPATAVPAVVAPIQATPAPSLPVQPEVIPPTAVPALAPRACDQIRGTPYRSEEERQFFLANCGVAAVAPSTNAGTSSGSTNNSNASASTAPTPVPPPAVVAPAVGTYAINRLLGTSSGVDVTISTIQVQSGGRIVVNFTYRNTGSVYGSAKLGCDPNTTPSTLSQAGGVSLRETDSFCTQNAGKQYDLRTNETHAEWIAFQSSNLDASQPISLQIGGWGLSNVYLR